MSLENRTYFTQTGSLTKMISHTALFTERLGAERDERKEKMRKKKKRKVFVSAKHEAERSHEIYSATNGLQVFLQTKG